MKEKKEYNRSIRMTNTVKEIVENFEGESFNEKFENLVLFCMNKIPETKNELKALHNDINSYNSMIKKKQETMRELDKIKYGVENLKREFDRMLNTAVDFNKKYY